MSDTEEICLDQNSFLPFMHPVGNLCVLLVGVCEYAAAEEGSVAVPKAVGQSCM